MRVSSLIRIFCELIGTDSVGGLALEWGALGWGPVSATCLLCDLGDEIPEPRLFLCGNPEFGNFLRSLGL